jgi:carboxymethylenebutenolidase
MLQRLVLDNAIRTPVVVAAGTASARTALVVMPAAFGIAPDVEQQLQHLAQHAAVVVAVDPFARDAPRPLPYTDTPAVMQRLQGLDRARATADFHAAIDHARHHAGRIVALGVCFGGVFALNAAADGLVDGAATWHGGRLESLMGRASEMRCPLRLQFGAVDPIVPPSAVEAIRVAFAGRDDVEVVVHAGATHGFTHRSAVAFDPVAEAAALAAVIDLLR